MDLWLIILAWYAFASLLTLAAYAWDKRQATAGGWRVSERKLQMFALGGGWLGALAGRALLRHKSRKRGFSIVLWLITLLHGTILVGIVFWR